MVVTLENKMFFNPFRLGQAENEKVQTDSPKKKAVGEKIVIDAEDGKVLLTHETVYRDRRKAPGFIYGDIRR